MAFTETAHHNSAVRRAVLDDEVRLMESAFFMSYPHDVYARMRCEQPVYWSERDAIWALTKYDDIRFASKTPQLFANEYHVYVTAARIEDDGDPHVGSSPSRRAELRRVDGRGPLDSDNLVMADGDRHRFLRRIAGYAFSPRAIAQLVDAVVVYAQACFDVIPVDAEVDFVDMVAAPVPMAMIAVMLGVPTELLPDFRRWSDAFIEMADETTHGDPDFDQRIAEVIEFREYFREQLLDRNDNPRDDLLTALARAEWKGAPLSIEDQLSMAQVLLIAGNETTRGLIAGAGLELYRHPDQKQILIDQPELLASAVEELLRYVTPVTHMCRTAMEDTEIRGTRIRAGDYLCLLYPSGNRDEEIWDRADELDVTRAPDPAHVAFGFAEHFCLGAQLARREARIVLGELLRRFPNYEIVGDTTRVRQHMTPGIKTRPAIFLT
jgi:cytochrome P450